MKEGIAPLPSFIFQKKLPSVWVFKRSLRLGVSVSSPVSSAFDACERDLVSELAVNLFTDAAAPPIISLVAELMGLLLAMYLLVP